MKLRDYQVRALDEMRAAYQAGKRSVLFVSPTGSGKSVTLSALCQGVYNKGKRCYVAAPRDELITQLSATLREFNIPHGTLRGGRIGLPRHPVVVASVFTLAKRAHKMKPCDLLILDECHHHRKDGGAYQDCVKAFPKALVMGCTATPCRLDMRGLGDVYDHMVVGPQVIDLTMQALLAPSEVYAPPSQMNLKGVHVRGGDYAVNELEEAIDKPTITGDAVTHYRKLAHGKRAVAFCVSIAHAKHVAEEFRAAGYRSQSVDGKMEMAQRMFVLDEFRRGNIDVLTSCALVNEGFDLKEIECGIMLRPTKSLSLFIQQVGRTLRPMKGKDKAIILDHAGLTQMHGFIDEIRDWKLEGSREKQLRAESAPAVRTCPFCFACFRPAPLCPVCGAAQPVQSRQVQHVDGELERVTAADEIFAAAETENRDRQFEILTRIAKDRGMRAPEQWAYHVMAAQTAADRRRREEYTPGYRTVNGLPESDDAELKARVERAMAKEGW